MRIILLLLFLAVMLGTGCSESEPEIRLEPRVSNYIGGQPRFEWNEALDKEGNYVKHGPFTLWHPNGRKQCEGEMHMGTYHGDWTVWRATGRKEFRFTFSKGKWARYERTDFETNWVRVYDAREKASRDLWGNGQVAFEVGWSPPEDLTCEVQSLDCPEDSTWGCFRRDFRRVVLAGTFTGPDSYWNADGVLEKSGEVKWGLFTDTRMLIFSTRQAWRSEKDEKDWRVMDTVLAEERSLPVAIIDSVAAEGFALGWNSAVAEEYNVSIAVADSIIESKSSGTPATSKRTSASRAVSPSAEHTSETVEPAPSTAESDERDNSDDTLASPLSLGTWTPVTDPQTVDKVSRSVIDYLSGTARVDEEVERLQNFPPLENPELGYAMRCEYRHRLDGGGWLTLDKMFFLDKHARVYQTSNVPH